MRRPHRVKGLTLSYGIFKQRNKFNDFGFFDGLIFFPFKIYLFKISFIIGWGYKATSIRAIVFARENGIDYVSIEDGFIRSVGLGVQGAPPLSLVIDYTGIYYSAISSSDLEKWILEKNLSDSDLDRAKSAISNIRACRLSKYNIHTLKNSSELTKIIVIDQTFGDASVTGAMANANTFIEMLKEAIANHPDETIWVKVHPDVVCGKKKGFLYPLPFEHPNVKVFAESINPWDMLESATDVYTVSSLMGFEALMAGAKVHCFGMPFYAGWGLTEDKLVCERRTVKRSLEQVFAAAYLHYARYVDPILERRCELEDIIPYIVDVMRHQAVPSETVVMQGISRWKRTWLSPFLQSWNLKCKVSSSSHQIGWGVQAGCTLTIEDGFIRSYGLGVHFNKPISLVLDRSGIYFDATRPSDLETILNGEISPYLIERAERLLPKLLESGITKYNVGSAQTLALPENRTVILVPGQVESDASIRYGSPEVKTNGELLLKVRQENPEAFLIYKPHPDVVAGQRDDGRWECEALNVADLVVSDVSMDALLQQVDEVHTMTSLAGFEALLRGKAVTTYGLPFYAGWGLTQDKRVCERRQRQLTLYELIAGALILYPTYIDPISRQLCTVEQALERLAQMKSGELKVKDYKLQTMLALKSVKKSIQHFFKK
ncbi:capsular polysaccharide biosynthesis protein [Vibrio cholerae]|uniref:capsular polysaccharide biosynthesis protein n=1 Tax=Vibrio cholerae TaxID=666 RepID=UPI000BA9756D|nr:capsular polysaccharide biosynthesis protein [Vibrio cholerae]PAS02686.1 capsule biosynthesis protein [Vibrio cholerae]TQO99587.1 capsular polysaccharide biosynthesis protein [Vibrio cholerae]TQQ19989.1 capsular polysaccharide biosynthesis protein [Vibrio cholerae]TQQ45288.1 capsular polysaccharide biosynthesis protein [Vibrio cholerae]